MYYPVCLHAANRRPVTGRHVLGPIEHKTTKQLTLTPHYSMYVWRNFLGSSNNRRGRQVLVHSTVCLCVYTQQTGSQ